MNSGSFQLFSGSSDWSESNSIGLVVVVVGISEILCEAELADSIVEAKPTTSLPVARRNSTCVVSDDLLISYHPSPMIILLVGNSITSWIVWLQLGDLCLGGRARHCLRTSVWEDGRDTRRLQRARHRGIHGQQVWSLVISHSPVDLPLAAMTGARCFLWCELG